MDIHRSRSSINSRSESSFLTSNVVSNQVPAVSYSEQSVQTESVKTLPNIRRKIPSSDIAIQTSSEQLGPISCTQNKTLDKREAEVKKREIECTQVGNRLALSKAKIIELESVVRDLTEANNLLKSKVLILESMPGKLDTNSQKPASDVRNISSTVENNAHLVNALTSRVETLENDMKKIYNQIKGNPTVDRSLHTNTSGNIPRGPVMPSNNNLLTQGDLPTDNINIEPTASSSKVAEGTPPLSGKATIHNHFLQTSYPKSPDTNVLPLGRPNILQNKNNPQNNHFNTVNYSWPHKQTHQANNRDQARDWYDTWSNQRCAVFFRLRHVSPYAIMASHEATIPTFGSGRIPQS